MNTKEYISTGIIESYVLGLASDEERIEFEKMCLLYPEVAEARKIFEKALEDQAFQSEIIPPEEIKQKLIEILNPGEESLKISRRSRQHLSGWLKYAVAASLILLAGSVYWNISLYERNERLKNNNTRLERELGNSSLKLAEVENNKKLLQSPDIKMTALKGTEYSPESFVTAYWDTTTKDVFLVINNLPEPPSDKQYQLWGLLDGQPTDLGVIEMNREKILPIIPMKSADSVQAFAITLEKKGGNSTPTMDAMYAKGDF